MKDCLFCKIVAGEIPAEIVADTDKVLAFRDIAPKAPQHLLVIPKSHYETAFALAQADPELSGELVREAGEIALAQGFADSGYRLMYNTGPDAGQEVGHVHLHILAGRPLGPMLAE
jgi:histidine triad (HIT) family protein